MEQGWNILIIIPSFLSILVSFLKYLLCTTLYTEMLFIARATVAKYHRLGVSNSQKFIFSQFWKLESEIKVSAGLVPSEGSEGRICSQSLHLACRWLSSPCVSCFPSMNVYVQISPFLYRCQYIASGPTPVTSFELGYLCKDLVTK